MLGDADRSRFARSNLGAILPLHDFRYRSIAHAARAFRLDGGCGTRSLRTSQIPAGGARRDRTDDLLLAKQALSQLSYGPALWSSRVSWWVWMESNHRPPPYQD